MAKNIPVAEPTTCPEAFAELVNLLAVFSEASNRLKELEATANSQLLEIIDEHKKDYSEYQEAATKAETALEIIARAHPDWFVAKKSIKTPYGTAKLTRATRTESSNEEATVMLLRSEARADEGFKADDYIRKQELPNYEALERLDDATLARFMVKRVVEEKFSVTAASVDMGKAVKEAVQKPKASTGAQA